jgi:PIN domain nuclease of toxin-antitoxin system
LDSHAFFWWCVDHPKLSRSARRAIENPDNGVYVSAVAAWEIATKVRLGRWNEASALASNFEDVIVRERFLPMPISIAHARLAGALMGNHGDPFDRMLAAQSQIENIPLVTADPVFKAFGSRVIW